MRLFLLFLTSLLAFLLLFSGCIKTNANEKLSADQTEQQKPRVSLGISDSDLQIDDPALDTTTDDFEGLGNP